MDEAGDYIKLKGSLTDAALCHDSISDRKVDDFGVVPDCFLRIGYEFDVGQICGDIGTWNARPGLRRRIRQGMLGQESLLQLALIRRVSY